MDETGELMLTLCCCLFFAFFIVNFIYLVHLSRQLDQANYVIHELSALLDRILK